MIWANETVSIIFNIYGFYMFRGTNLCIFLGICKY